LETFRRNVLILCLTLTAPLAQGVAAAAEAPPPDQVIVQGKRGDLVKAAKEVQLLEQRFFQRYNEINTKKDYAVRCYNEAPTGTRFKQKYCKPVYEPNAEAAEAREFMTALGRGTPAGSTSGGGSASSGVMAMGGASAGATGGAGLNAANMAEGTGVSQGTGNGAVSAGAQVASPAGVSAPLGGGGTVAAFVDIETERPAFQKNVVEVVGKSPELQKLLQEHEEARQRYEAIYQRMHESDTANAKP
jgi:hypothetical protein